VTAAAIVFWASAALVAYVYAGYPLLLWIWSRVRPRPIRATAPAAGEWPGVSIVIAARNEAARLGPRLDNLLALDYPPDRRQVIVVSDGSTDDTADVVRSYGGRVDLVCTSPGGKARALNAGVAHARFDILVFADARQVFAPDALRQLVAPLSDTRVGAVSGELLLDAESALFSNRRARADRRRGHANQLGAAAIERRLTGERRRPIASTIADGVGMYWRYEKELRRMESAVGSMLGATGAIYAVRRRLWEPLPPDTILDDVLTPMRVVMAGHRVVFEERARAFDRAAADADTESRRKVRTLAGNYQILAREPRLLLPWVNPVWFQYLSHKVGRLLVPYALVAMFVTSIPLAAAGRVYLVALIAQVMFYLLAGYGAMLELEGRRSAATKREGRASARQRPGTPVREVGNA
jgi:cellulose synthase/poly-beta-1,6-N-acetylglucosamine synthase-like glycosyltransferase